MGQQHSTSVLDGLSSVGFSLPAARWRACATSTKPYANKCLAKSPTAFFVLRGTERKNDFGTVPGISGFAVFLRRRRLKPTLLAARVAQQNYIRYDVALQYT